jgi:hypothetical protein
MEGGVRQAESLADNTLSFRPKYIPPHDSHFLS